MIGETIGNYRIASQIGSGGMGAVYEAHHELLGKSAAIKVLLPERSANREIVKRFFNEARAVSAVHHPGIPEIFDFGHLPSGNAYIIMELLEGETLGDRLKRERPLSAKESVSIGRHIAGVLSAAHSRGVIHRDLKPDNIFLVPDPALPRGERAKILDFGIAKLASEEERPSKVRTETGRLMGTPYYMSPEQCRGSGHVDHRSDIYALGCVLYQMLTGRPPFVLEGSGEILAAHIHVPPLPPRQINASIPVPVEQIVMRLLAKDPDQRFQTMEQVIVAFNDAFDRGQADIDSEPSLRVSSTRMPAAFDDSIDSSTGRRARSESFSGPTTLGTAASQSMATISESRGAPSWLMYGGLVLAAVAVAVLIYRGVGSGSSEPEVSAAAATGNSEPAFVVDPKPIVRQIIEPDAEVSLLIESEPDGASVYRESDGVFVGTTPVRYQVRRGAGEAMFILKKSGFKPAKLAMSATKDDAFMVELTRKRGERKATRLVEAAASKGANTVDEPPPEDKEDGVEKPAKAPEDKAIDPFNFMP